MSSSPKAEQNYIDQLVDKQRHRYVEVHPQQRDGWRKHSNRTNCCHVRKMRQDRCVLFGARIALSLERRAKIVGETRYRVSLRRASAHLIVCALRQQTRELERQTRELQSEMLAKKRLCNSNNSNSSSRKCDNVVNTSTSNNCIERIRLESADNCTPAVNKRPQFSQSRFDRAIPTSSTCSTTSLRSIIDFLALDFSTFRQISVFLSPIVFLGVSTPSFFMDTIIIASGSFVSILPSFLVGLRERARVVPRSPSLESSQQKQRL